MFRFHGVHMFSLVKGINRGMGTGETSVEGPTTSGLWTVRCMQPYNTWFQAEVTIEQPYKYLVPYGGCS